MKWVATIGYMLFVCIFVEGQEHTIYNGKA